jgi:hypothetical protein
VNCPEVTTFNYNGMAFETCVDSCMADKTLTYHDGTEFFLEGDPSYSSEWVYISHTTEDLTLSIVGYESGNGIVQWLWYETSAFISPL